ncbi:MAG: prephenate dehydrogenase/arogenate dehydrogenase family protein [Ardenticatenaceae bacterium]|nr:prephenate dehydrogenase/arogenate dehydrogenase family protein [Ardenticatenaceae bacterium]
MKVKTISIIGLNKQGASIGLRFKQKLPDLQIVGHDRNREALKVAKESGAIDRAVMNLVSAVSEGDIIFISLPFAEMEETIVALSRGIQEHAVIIDFSPLKKPVQKWVNAHLSTGHYVSAMPILNVDGAKDLRPGPEAATAELFANSVMCLMPGPKVDEGAVQTVEQIGRILGAESFYVDMEEFDIYAQALETLPGLLGAAYFRALTSATGWQDMRRMANQTFTIATNPLGSEEDLAHMAFQNKAAAIHWLDTIVEYLLEMRRWVQNGDQETLAALMTELNIQREQWLHDRKTNDWQEQKSPKIENRGMMEQLFGSFGARRIRRDED